MATGVLEYLRELVALTGPSGAEGDVARAIAARVKPLAGKVEMDALGNVIARRAGAEGGRTCLLAAHTDEIGFRIRAIDRNGFLRFEKVGGSDNRVLLAQRLWVQGERGRMLGIIGTRSAHLLRDSDRNSVPAHTDLYIDIGARSEEEARAMGVRLGAPAGFAGELAELGLNSGRYTAHALDDRVGCAVILALLDRLQGEQLPFSLIAVFSVQEEVGLRGAQAAARSQQFDVGLAVDTTAVDDTPEIGTGYLRLGAGAAIKIMDNSQLAHPALVRGMEEAAARVGIPVQGEILMGIGTDAGALQFGGAGVPAGTLSIGTRYTHTPVEVLDVRDLEGAVDLLEAFVRALPDLDLRFAQLD